MLPARRWKLPLQLDISRGDVHGSTLPTANKDLFADLEVSTSGEGDEVTSPSFTAKIPAIGAPSSSLEALIAALYMQRGCEWKNFTDGKQNTCLPIFNCFQTERATRQRRPLLKLKTQRLALPARRWKRSLQLGICTGDVTGALYRQQTKYLFADL